MRNILVRQWFMAALIVVLIVGFTAADQLVGMADAFPVAGLVAVILFLMSWSLDSSAMWQAIRRPQAAILAVVVNMLLLPAMAWGVMFLLRSPLDTGLALTVAVPSTLASAAVWTRRAGGNDAVALLVTGITNFSCFLTTPLVLWIITGLRTDAAFNPLLMMVYLLKVAVLPILCGQLMRLCPPMARWATERKAGLSAAVQIGVLAIVLVGAVRSTTMVEESGNAASLGFFDWISVVAAVSAIHLGMLFVGFGLGRLSGLPRADWIAVGISGSQKTLPIGLLIAQLPGVGASVVPLVVYHAIQLLADTIVADRLKQSGAVKAPIKAA